MLKRNIFGIDMGTSMVKVYSHKKNHIVAEKNILAIRNKKYILAVGNEAYEKYEKNPDTIDIKRSMSYGMIADIDSAQVVLSELLFRADKHMGKRASLVFAVPMDMTEIEKRAYFYITKTSELKKFKIHLLERPLADAVALGIDIESRTGSLVVNIGAQSTEISIISEGKVIVSKVLHIGGENLNRAIRDNVRRRKNLLIGDRTAQRLKHVLATFDGESKAARKIVGLNTLSGLPREGIISSAFIQETIRETIKNIGEEIRFFLERTPPQVAKIVRADGIYLAGGSSQIPHLGDYLKDYLGCPVRVSEDYDMCTIQGLKTIIADKNLRFKLIDKNEKMLIKIKE